MSGQSTSTQSASATVAEEEYLQLLFWLQEAGLPMTGANIAGHIGPSTFGFLVRSVAG
jgi:hypothetical protein